MENEIPLPPPPRRRKSHRPSRFDDRSSQPSSDPALFSSDDIPASGLENYHAPAHGNAGRKRRYRGTWWGETVLDPKRKRKDFKDKRFVDSGVWMGSDESLVESLLPSEDAPISEDFFKNVRNSNPGIPKKEPEEVDAAPFAPAAPGPESVLGMDRGPISRPQPQVVAQPRVAFRRVVESQEHQLARAIVNDCLEKGQDSVDLSIGNMKEIPSGLLRPLQHLTKLPAIREPPVTEDVYSSLEPFLRLFLAGNSLFKLSSELFDLSSLKVLSLRNNKLSEIPPAIRRLTSLQDVNLSVNRLQYLPWEFLWLIRKGDLKHLIVRPNPLMQIDETEIAYWHYPNTTTPESLEESLRLQEYESPVPEEAWAPIHIATGPIRHFNTDGYPIPEAQLNATSFSELKSNVPSLREVSLVSLNKSNFFDLTPDSDIADLPELMLRLLRHAREVRAAGGRCCSICHRDFVLPRTEWIEWWDCSTYENGLKGPRASGEKLRPLPFKRLGCSWGCVPDMKSVEITHLSDGVASE
ncbi:leucine-rich repeat domain-containing protein [Aspergillus chevalieri]|uniref:Leucine Rich Repeat domain protein n=1 Tax=Aspergillus chevalieri TaxID=182096 RepID=A0A7R7VIL2_ASPCH|nr:uncharacterized protein ACHE_20850A [Aspergillus chevalieri]BCR85392.1 hypothetical protein ACHE_20850A [Aspergillus chevalieri]